MAKKVGTVVLIGMAVLLLTATRTVSSDTAPYFIVKDSFQAECGRDSVEKCYFVILQPVSPIRFVASVSSMEELPLNGEGQQCRVQRIDNKVGDQTYSRIHLLCKKWEGDVNMVIFQPR